MSHDMKGRATMNLNRDRFLASQRGATMVSVMLLTISLLTLGLLVVRSSAREVTQAGQLVARERALVSAQSALDLAAAQYLAMAPLDLDLALVGAYPQGATCDDPCGDCIPDPTNIVTGQRNDLLMQGSDCGGRPCMRQGAVASLRDATGATSPWCDRPIRDLVAGDDAEARVSVWIRNHDGDAIGRNVSGLWTDDGDGRVVITAMATVRNTSIAIEQEVLLTLQAGPTPLLPQSPDEGYGGGHNNDNSAVSVCPDTFVVASAAP
jgi:Tfp pilus assembly protein PilX